MANDRQAEMAENHQLIFEKLFEILKSAASYFVYEEKLDPANAFVFCLDLDSFWIDCFKGIPVIRKDEQIPENLFSAYWIDHIGRSIKTFIFSNTNKIHRQNN